MYVLLLLNPFGFDTKTSAKLLADDFKLPNFRALIRAPSVLR